MRPVGTPDAQPVAHWDRLAAAVVTLGMFFAPMPKLEISLTPLVTLADVFFVMGFGMMLPRLLRTRVSGHGSFLTGALILTTGIFVSLAVHPGSGQSTTALRLLYALVVLAAMMLLWAPSRAQVSGLSLAYLGGTVVSVLYGLPHGGGSRNLGLTLDPNGLGYTCLFSMALLPLLFEQRPRLRWVLWGGAAICVVGLWTGGSRGALIAAGIVFLVYTAVERSAVAALFMWGGAAAVLMLRSTISHTKGNNVLARLLGEGGATGATGQRQQALQTGLHQINDNPVFGAGFAAIRGAHNIYVQLAAAIGLPALVGLILILGGFALPIFNRRDPLRKIAYLAIAFIVLGPLSDSLYDTLGWAPLSMCVLLGGRRSDAEVETPTGTPARGSLGLSAASTSS